MADIRGTGPLSYSVEAADGDLSAERPIILGSVTAIVATLPALVLGWVALGSIAVRVLVLLVVSVIGPALGLGVAFLTSPGRRRRRRNALVGVGGVGLFVAVVAYNLLAVVRPAVPELRAAIEDIRFPAGFVELSEEAKGDRLCKSQCPTVERFYRADGMEDPGRELLRALFRQGWDPANPSIPPDSNTAAVRGRILVDVYFTTGEPTVRIVVTGRSGGFGGIQG